MGYRSGMVVRLKSGGPDMTVHGVIGDPDNSIGKTIEANLKLYGHEKGEVYCRWFDEKNEQQIGMLQGGDVGGGVTACRPPQPPGFLADFL